MRFSDLDSGDGDDLKLSRVKSTKTIWNSGLSGISKLAPCNCTPNDEWLDAS